MKKLILLSRIASICLAGSLLLASCSNLFGGDDDNPLVNLANKILPKALAVAIPKSLVGDGSFNSPRAARAGENNAGTVVTRLRENVYSMKSSLGMVAMEAAMIDELLYQGKYEPSDTEHAGEMMELTSALFEKMTALGEASDIDMEGMEGMVGTEQEVPAFIYNNADAPYSFCLLMAIPAENDPEYGYFPAQDQNFYWSSDKTKVKMEIIEEGGDSFAITYNDSTKTSAFVMSYGDYNFTMTISEAQDVSDKNGAYVFYETKYTYQGQSGDVQVIDSAKGYADDDGGYLALTTAQGQGMDAQVNTSSVVFDAAGITTDASSGDYSSNAYVTAAGSIDETIIEYADSSKELAGDSIEASFSVDARTYSVSGIAAGTSVLVFDQEVADFMNPPAGIIVVGSGYSDAADKVTVFIDCYDVNGDPALMPTSGTLYFYSFDGESDPSLAGTITL